MRVLPTHLLTPLLCAMFCASAPHLYADTITLNGVTYRDVLIYKSSSMYYVKVPHEGRIFNVPVDSVGVSQVSMVKDPYYRDELKMRYERARAGMPVRVPGSSSKGGESAFQILEPDNEAGESNESFLSGGGSGKGFGIPRSQIESLLSGLGFTFKSSANSATGKSADGTTTIQLSGPSDNLRGLTLRLSAPKAQAASLQTGLQQSALMFQDVAPWASQWLVENADVLRQGGAVEKTQDGTRISLRVTISGGDVTSELQVHSV